ncbi:hypothetical protein OROGR_024862 [Orobanche gracilis]
MEESKKNQEKKKIIIKMGGGGIGGVVLLGGAALATAALASAFVVGKRALRSVKDRRRRRSPPPQINKEKEKDEADKPEQLFFPDQPSHVNENPSCGAIKGVGSDNDTGTFPVRAGPRHKQVVAQRQELLPCDLWLRVRFIGTALVKKLIRKSLPPMHPCEDETQDNICDTQTSEKFYSSVSPENLKIDAIRDVSVVTEEKVPPPLDVKLRFDPHSMMHEYKAAMIQSIKEDVYNEIAKGNRNLEQPHIEDEEEEGAESELGEIIMKQPKQEENNEVCYDPEEIKVILADNTFESVCVDRKEVGDNENTEVDTEMGDLEEGQNCLMSLSHNHVTGNENVSGGVEICSSPAGNGFIMGSEECDRMKGVEEQLVKEQEKREQSNDIILVEKREARIELMKNACVVYPNPENFRFGSETLENDQMVFRERKDRENDLERETEKEAEEEIILPKNIEVTILSDEVKDDHECKDSQIIDEDSFFEPHQEKPESITFTGLADDSSRFCGENSEKAFVKKYVSELTVSDDQKYLTNPTIRKIVVATLSFVSSLSCSRFFGLSLVKLFVIVLLTMVLSSMLTE